MVILKNKNKNKNCEFIVFITQVSECLSIVAAHLKKIIAVLESYTSYIRLMPIFLNSIVSQVFGCHSRHIQEGQEEDKRKALQYSMH